LQIKGASMGEISISEKTVSALPSPRTGSKLHYFSGATLQGKKAPSGFAVRVTSAGSKSFVWFHRVNGKGYLETLGRWDDNAKGGDLTVRDAIVAAQKRAKAVRDGDDPRPQRTRRQAGVSSTDTVTGLLDEFIDRYAVKERKLRSANQITRAFDRLVKPAIGKIGVYELRRSDVARMLDKISDKHGLIMADRTLAYIRKAFNWRAARDDNFHPPIAKGMARVKPKERERHRVLTDAELQAVWKAAEAPADTFGAFVRFLLLTATRRNEAAQMRHSELSGHDWTLPAARNKVKVDFVIPLSLAAQGVLAEMARDKSTIVFSTDGITSISGFSKFKRKLDEACGVVGWTLHDLRRTARSLMSRAGVPSDHAERSLGHTMMGVRGVYDRHEFYLEKKRAFEMLAAEIRRIVEAPGSAPKLKRP
jgi:integrase